MFNEISWGEYALAVTLILIAYYTAIGLWLYILKLKMPVSGSKLTVTTGQEEERIKETVSTTSFEETPDETFKQVEALMHVLKAVIAKVFYHKQGRKVLLENLSRTLQKHPEFVGTPFQEGVQEFIIRECDKHGPVGLRVDEVEELWSAEV